MEHQNNNEKQQRTLITIKGKLFYTYKCSSSKCSNPQRQTTSGHWLPHDKLQNSTQIYGERQL